MVAGKTLSAMQLHLKDGRVIEATSRPTADGGWVSAHEDVTERLRYEDKLREQNVLFDAAIGNMVQALCMYDADNRLIVSNGKYASFFNADPEVVKPGRHAARGVRARRRARHVPGAYRRSTDGTANFDDRRGRFAFL